MWEIELPMSNFASRSFDCQEFFTEKATVGWTALMRVKAQYGPRSKDTLRFQRVANLLLMLLCMRDDEAFHDVFHAQLAQARVHAGLGALGARQGQDGRCALLRLRLQLSE